MRCARGPLMSTSTLNAARKSAWAIADQALFAGSNFLVSVTLARAVAPAQYGMFSAVYTAFQLLIALHQSAYIEPMLVHGARRTHESFWDYFVGLFRSQALALTLLSLSGLIAAWLLPMNRGMRDVLVVLSVVGPFILSQMLLRRAFYALMEPSRAARVGLVYAAVTAALLTPLLLVGHLSVPVAFGVMGVASLTGSLAALLGLRKWRLMASGHSSSYAIGEWGRYVRWSLPTTLLTWVPGNIYYVALPALKSFAVTGALQATMNLAMPILQVNGAVSVLLVPALVKRLGRGVASYVSLSRLFGAIVLGIAGVYAVLLVVLGPWAIPALYGGVYDIGRVELLSVATVPMGAALVAWVGSALRAMERPDLVMRTYLLSFVFSLVGGVPLMLAFGSLGSVWALSASSLLTGVVMFAVWRAAVAKRMQEPVVIS